MKCFFLSPFGYDICSIVSRATNFYVHVFKMIGRVGGLFVKSHSLIESRFEKIAIFIKRKSLMRLFTSIEGVSEYKRVFAMRA